MQKFTRSDAKEVGVSKARFIIEDSVSPPETKVQFSDGAQTLKATFDDVKAALGASVEFTSNNKRAAVVKSEVEEAISNGASQTVIKCEGSSITVAGSLDATIAALA